MQAPHERLTSAEQHELAMHLVGVVLHKKTGPNLAGLPHEDLRRARDMFVQARWDSALPALDAEIARVTVLRAERAQMDEALHAGRVVDVRWLYLNLCDDDRKKALDCGREASFRDSDGNDYFGLWWRAEEPGLWATLGIAIYRSLLSRMQNASSTAPVREAAAFVWDNLTSQQRLDLVEAA